MRTQAQALADFAAGARFEDIPLQVVERLKVHVLDSLGCAIGALERPLLSRLKSLVDAFGGSPTCSLVGGGATNPNLASFYNGALVRYLDFNDSFLAPGETCHPSDNFAPLLAAGEESDASGRELLTALAVAYQVQCRLSEVAPVRDKGFDHVTQGAYAVAAGVSRVLRLDRESTANAIAIAGTAFPALRVSRTGRLSNWKGLAYPQMAAGVAFTTYLASRGVTGPLEVFEGNKGFMDSISGQFTLDWAQEALDRVDLCLVKRFNAEIHSQSALEAALELRARIGGQLARVQRVEVDIFAVAFNIIGGGEEGDKHIVATKEEADHSLPYLVSVALLDGQVMPAQFSLDRIRRADVQALLAKVQVRPDAAFSARFPQEMCARVTLLLEDGTRLSAERVDYEGFHRRPFGWKAAEEKFELLSSGSLVPGAGRRVIEAAKVLESIPVRELALLLRLEKGRPHAAQTVAS